MAYNEKRIQFHGKVKELRYRENFNNFLSQLYKKNWIVYSKKPFDNPVNVFKYLGRYTHRIAISNSRIVNVTDKEVSFRWKDYRNGNKKKIMTLPVEEFMRRFLLHTLPKGFKRIRFYGLLSNRYKKDNIKAIRELLNDSEDTLMEIKESVPELILIENDDKIYKCPKCQSTDVTIKELPIDYLVDYYWNTS